MNGGKLFTIFTVVVVCMFGVTKTYVLPAGKCRSPPIELNPIKYKSGKGATLEWDVVYVPDAEPFRQIDHHLISVPHNGVMKSSEECTTVFKNGTTSSHTGQQSYLTNYVYETVGSRIFYIYPLVILEDHSVIYYRCSDTGELSVDTRYIAVPKGTRLSETSRQRLLAVDRKYNFTGDFLQLPYEFYNEV